jgi:hypothetical protein
VNPCSTRPPRRTDIVVQVIPIPPTIVGTTQ